MMVVSSGLDGLRQTISVYQQLQRLLPVTATLSDVADLVATAQAEYGAEILLEDVIQNLVGEHLAVQMGQRGIVGLEAAA